MDIKELLNCLEKKEKMEKAQAAKVIFHLLEAFNNNTGFLTAYQVVSLRELKVLFEKNFQPYMDKDPKGQDQFWVGEGLSFSENQTIRDFSPEPGK